MFFDLFLFPQLRIISQDGFVFETTYDTAVRSKYLRTILEESGIERRLQSHVKLLYVSSAVIARQLQYSQVPYNSDDEQEALNISWIDIGFWRVQQQQKPNTWRKHLIPRTCIILVENQTI